MQRQNAQYFIDSGRRVQDIGSEYVLVFLRDTEARLREGIHPSTGSSRDTSEWAERRPWIPVRCPRAPSFQDQYVLVQLSIFRYRGWARPQRSPVQIFSASNATCGEVAYSYEGRDDFGDLAQYLSARNMQDRSPAHADRRLVSLEKTVS